MAKCNKCDVEVDTRGERCPLCAAKIEKTIDPTYPTIKTTSTWQFIKRIMIIFVLCTSIIVVFLNGFLTPNMKWSGFVIAALLSMYTVFLGIVKGRKRILSMMFYMSFAILAITFIWDRLIGYKGWSLNYVLPSVAIGYGVFLLILRFVSHFAIKNYRGYIYLHILLEFLPLVMYVKNVVTFEPLALVSACFGTINLLVLLVFDFSHLKNDLGMRLHI